MPKFIQRRSYELEKEEQKALYGAYLILKGMAIIFKRNHLTHDKGKCRAGKKTFNTSRTADNYVSIDGARDRLLEETKTFFNLDKRMTKLILESIEECLLGVIEGDKNVPVGEYYRRIGTNVEASAWSAQAERLALKKLKGEK